MSWVHEKAIPGRSQSNGLVERMVRHVQEGTRCLLLQAGLHPKWWPYASRSSFLMNNVQKKDGNSPWMRRFAMEDFKGKLIPFGVVVDCIQQPAKEDRQMKYASRTGEDGDSTNQQSLPLSARRGDSQNDPCSEAWRFRDSLDGMKEEPDLPKDFRRKMIFRGGEEPNYMTTHRVCHRKRSEKTNLGR
eukprot:6491616-Amphidinium_carterae.3